MELKADEGSKWGLVAIGVGESKIYHYSPKAKKGNRIVDITANNRLHARDERGKRSLHANDAGKPYLRRAFPQIREAESGRTSMMESQTFATCRSITSRASQAITSSSSRAASAQTCTHDTWGRAHRR